MSKFVRAERKRVKLKIAITGPSGSGKTYSALGLASGIGQKIALIDTENDSASLYSDRFVFDTLVIDPPYTIDKYIEAMKSAEQEGFDVVIVDSLTHAWAGEGGILSKKNAMDARGGNSFTNWGQLTPEQERLVATILNLNAHMIGTIRSKQEYVVEPNDKGKSAPRKVGMAPIQREGMEYEFTTVFDVAMDHNAQVSKDRTGLFDGQFFRIGKDTGQHLMAWLGGATAEARVAPVIAPPAEATKAAPQPISDKQVERLFTIISKVGIPTDQAKAIVKEYGYESSKDILRSDYNEICDRIEAWKVVALVGGAK